MIDRLNDSYREADQGLRIIRDDHGYRMTIAPEVELELPTESPIQLRRLAGGQAARAVGVGAIADVTEYWQKLEAWAAAHGYQSRNRRWLELVSDPSQTAAADRVTHFYLAVE